MRIHSTPDVQLFCSAQKHFTFYKLYIKTCKKCCNCQFVVLTLHKYSHTTFWVFYIESLLQLICDVTIALFCRGSKFKKSRRILLRVECTSFLCLPKSVLHQIRCTLRANLHIIHIQVITK